MSTRGLTIGPDDDLHCHDCGDTGWQEDREGRSLCSCIAETDAGRELAALLATTQAARDVLAERQRQIEVEGFDAARDDEYHGCELAAAAACYALCDTLEHVKSLRIGGAGVSIWPFPLHWWKSTTYRRNLTKAGALILAEIERLDRAEAKATTQEPPR